MSSKKKDDNTILGPDGKVPESKAEEVNERTIVRATEDEAYVPVIVKRRDEVKRHPDDILEHAISEGLEQIERPLFSLILSSVAAGLILGFTAMAVGVVNTFTMQFDIPLLPRMGTALVYPLGFIVCILAGTQLFTEHTATAVYPVLDRKANPLQLARLWLAVIVGNVGGAFLSSQLIVAAEPVIHAKEGYIEAGSHLVSYEFTALFVSALLAGWLMAQGAWLILSTAETVSQIISIYIVTFLIGLGGLHHSIAGSVEMFVAYFISDSFSTQQVYEFIGTALLGNLVGGSCFVALLNYAHIRETQRLRTKRSH